MKRIIAILIMLLVIGSMTLIASADEIEMPAESAEETEASSEVALETSVETSTETAKEEKTTSDDGTFWEDIGNTLRDAWMFAVENRDTILGGLSTAISSLAIFVMQKVFKPTVKSIDKRYNKFVEEVTNKIQATSSIVSEYAKKVDALIADYAKEKTDKHAADAFAQICHEQSLLLHKVIVQSSLAPSIKEEANRIYANSEKEIDKVLNGLKGGDVLEG